MRSVRARVCALFGLLAALLVAGCTAEPEDAARSSPPKPDSEPSKEFLRPKTDLEIFVIRVVRGTGANRVRVAEPAHGDPDADIWGLWMGKEIFIRGYPIEVEDASYEILDDTYPDGHQVLEAREFGRRKLVTDCRGYTYEVSKSLDDRWDEDLMFSFVKALVDSAGC